MRLWKAAALFAASASLAFAAPQSRASSHSDAPLIKLDPQANLTDVYAFIRNDNGKNVLYVVVSCRPFSNPGDGVSYEKFSDDALYSIHIADPSTGATRIRYDFRFSPVGINGNYKNLNTILNYGLGTEAGPIEHVGDARQNYVQNYTVTKTVNGTSTTLASRNGNPLIVPPPNVGARTTPFYNDSDGKAVSGFTEGNLDRYTQEGLSTLKSGETVFAGSREDSFYADAPGIFDLLNPRILNTDGKGVDDFKGFNVLTYALEIPVDSLNLGANKIVGVYASVSRQRITLRNSDGSNVNSGPWIQVNRLGNPLFNEVLVALADKDNYNRMSPTQDAAFFAKYAATPEVAHLINFLYGDVLMQAYGRKLVETGRTDLVGIFIPDVLRVDTSAPTRIAGEDGFDRLSIFSANDKIMSPYQGKTIPGGWPNGRRFGDDVVDIALTAVASGPTFSQIIPLGDNVNHNDAVYNMTFPYAATPNSGTFHRYDPEP